MMECFNTVGTFICTKLLIIVKKESSEEMMLNSKTGARNSSVFLKIFIAL